MIPTKHNPTEYVFNKDLAANIIYAEVKNFHAEENIHGRTEEEVQTLTRTIQARIDADLRWTDVDGLISYFHELSQIHNGTHPNLDVNRAGTIDNTDQLISWVMKPLFWEIEMMVANITERVESDFRVSPYRLIWAVA